MTEEQEFLLKCLNDTHHKLNDGQPLLLTIQLHDDIEWYKRELKSLGMQVRLYNNVYIRHEILVFDV